MSTKALSTQTTPPPITPTPPANWTNNKHMLELEAFFDVYCLTLSVVLPILTVLILVSVTPMLIVLLSSARLRGKLRNQLLISLLAMYLVVGVEAIFKADLVVKRSWVHGCYLIVILQFLCMYVQDFVILWSAVELLAHYVARVQNYNGPAWLVRLPASLQRAVNPLVVALPWLLAAAFMAPLTFTGETTKFWRDVNCPLYVKRLTVQVLAALANYLPAAALIALSIAAIVLHRRRTNNPGVGPIADGDGEGRFERIEAGKAEDVDDLEPPKAYVLTALSVVLLTTPEYIFEQIVYLNPHPSLVPTETLFAVSSSLNMLECLLPFANVILWLVLFRDLRERLAELWAFLLWRLPCCQLRSPPKSTGDTTVLAVAFRDLHDE